MKFPEPKNFQYKEVFYFDGNIALVKGCYKKANNDSLGMRWMVGESKLGYPSTFGKPMWMVVPFKLSQYILEGIFNNLEREREHITDFQAFMDALEFVRSHSE